MKNHEFIVQRPQILIFELFFGSTHHLKFMYLIYLDLCLVLRFFSLSN